MSNRSEMLHFRATPEEKAAIEVNARANNESLSDWIRGRALPGFIPTQPVVGESPGEEAKTEPSRFPPFEQPDPPLANPGDTFICCGQPKDGKHEPWCAVRRRAEREWESD